MTKRLQTLQSVDVAVERVYQVGVQQVPSRIIVLYIWETFEAKCDKVKVDT